MLRPSSRISPPSTRRRPVSASASSVLAVAVHTRDAHDLARAHVEAKPLERGDQAVARRAQVSDAEHLPGLPDGFAFLHREYDVFAPP